MWHTKNDQNDQNWLNLRFLFKTLCYNGMRIIVPISANWRWSILITVNNHVAKMTRDDGWMKVLLWVYSQFGFSFSPYDFSTCSVRLVVSLPCVFSPCGLFALPQLLIPYVDSLNTANSQCWLPMLFPYVESQNNAISLCWVPEQDVNSQCWVPKQC
jgi:hypothetical protein